MKIFTNKIKFVDILFRKICGLVSLTLIILTIFLIYVMIKYSMPSIQKFGLNFLSDTNWDPVTEKFGALPFIYGTIVSSLLALIIAVPLSLGIAIYLSEIAPLWVRKPLSFLFELLAAIPSVIYGMWGIFVLAPLLKNYVQPFLSKFFGFLPIFSGDYYGVGLMASGIILSIMIIPTISSVSRDVFLSVPDSLREAAMALGATQWETIKISVLKYAKTGVIGAIILGLGRALGETMAVTMVIGNKPEISTSLFAPSYTMASVIANEFTEATSDLYIATLIEIGLCLFVVTFLLNIIARLLVLSISSKLKGVTKE
jgi:phosphate transport system permease protein